MTEEIINADGSRNWEANILLDNIKRLEQENKELKRANQSLSILGTDLASANETVRKEFFRADKNKDMWREKAEEYRSALEEIKNIITQAVVTNNKKLRAILDKINEVLG